MVVPLPTGTGTGTDSAWEDGFREVYQRRFGHALTGRQFEIAGDAARRVARSARLDMSDYVGLLGSLPLNSPLVQALLAPSTNKESYFFRDEASTATLRDRVLPELIARRSESRVLRVWSAGCATGEEIYSLAILLDELLPPGESWSVTLLGTDIDESALAVARRGLYREWSLRTSDERQRARYFTRDAATGVYALHPRYRHRVHFDVFNLVDPRASTPAPGVFDLILCRNVSIYFSATARTELARRLGSALARDGAWVSGASDPLPPQGFNTTVYPGLLYHSPSTPPSPAPALTEIPSTACHSPRPAHFHRASAERSTSREPRPSRSAAHLTGIRPLPQPSDEERAQLLTDQAREAGDRGELDRARQLLAEAIALGPARVEPHLVSAMIHLAADDPTAAVEDYRRALYLEPQRAETYLRMGLVLIGLGRRADAIRALRNAIVLAASSQDHIETRKIAGQQLARLLGERDAR